MESLRPLSKMSTPPGVGGSISKLVEIRVPCAKISGNKQSDNFEPKVSGNKQSDNFEAPKLVELSVIFYHENEALKKRSSVIRIFFACGGLKIIQ